MAQALVSRRDLLRKTLLASAAFGAAGVLAACSKKEEAKALTCTDTAGLSPQEIEARTTLGYVDKAPDATKKCSGCALYNPAPAPNACGGCKALKGPIHPDGWCKSFAPKPA